MSIVLEPTAASDPIATMSAADKALGGEPIGRSVSATLSSRTGRWIV